MSRYSLAPFFNFARVKLTDRFRNKLSGEKAADSIFQQAAELNKADKSKRKKIFEAAGYRHNELSKTQALALRIKLGLSVGRHRIQRQILRKLGIHVPSEKTERKKQKQLMCGEIKVERRNMLFVDESKREIEVPTPVGFISDIPQLMTDLLEQNHQHGQLTWHEGQIPDDEIWVNTGAVHGEELSK